SDLHGREPHQRHEKLHHGDPQSIDAGAPAPALYRSSVGVRFMPPLVATVAFVVLIIGLLRLDRDGASRPSPALWLPVAWMFIGASRMASQWLGVEPLDAMDTSLEGSFFDRVVLTGLLVAGWVVLAARGERVAALLRANKLLVVFFCYCTVSVLWSDFPF